MKKQKVRVTERAIAQRINRVLMKEHLQLKKSRGAQMALDVGEWYVIDLRGSYIADKHCDLVKLAKQHKVLNDWEEIC